MNKLFLTTAILALGISSASAAQSYEAKTFSAAEFTQMIKAVNTSSTATDFHAGDFQINTKSVKVNRLYLGEGSSLMPSIRMHRD